MAATGLLTKGITLGYKASTASSYTNIPDLQECPQLGGAPEKVEVTTLEDSARRYIAGVKEYGDLAFTFLYDNTASTGAFAIVSALDEDTVYDWEVEFPDGTKFDFSGQCSWAISGGGVNAALTFSLNIALNSDITVA